MLESVPVRRSYYASHLSDANVGGRGSSIGIGNNNKNIYFNIDSTYSPDITGLLYIILATFLPRGHSLHVTTFVLACVIMHCVLS